MSEQSKNEDYISLIESENEKHLFFSGSLNRLSAFNLNGQLVACDMAYREKKTENEFGFIQKDEQKAKTTYIFLILPKYSFKLSRRPGILCFLNCRCY